MKMEVEPTLDDYKARLEAIQADLGRLSAILSETYTEWEKLVYERIETVTRISSIEN